MDHRTDVLVPAIVSNFGLLDQGPGFVNVDAVCVAGHDVPPYDKSTPSSARLKGTMHTASVRTSTPPSTPVQTTFASPGRRWRPAKRP